MSVAFRRFLIMLAGATTTLITWVLAGVADLGEELHTFAFVVVPLPIGALLLGLLAGSGYGISGWFLTRLRFTTAMLKAIAASMLVSYAVFAYIDYLDHAPKRMGFLEYFHETTMNSHWDTDEVSLEEILEDPTSMPEPMGGDGYGYRFVELLGLLMGGMGAVVMVPALRKRYGLDA